MKKRMLATLVALLLILSAAGCTRGASDPLAYTKEPFSATVRGRVCRTAPDGRGDGGDLTEVSAEVSVDPVAGTATVVFTAPETLAGIEASRDAVGVVTVRRGELTLSGDAFAGLMRIADALLPAGDVVSRSPVRDGTYTATVRSGSTETVMDYAEGAALPARIRMTDGHGWVDLYINKKTS